MVFTDLVDEMGVAVVFAEEFRDLFTRSMWPFVTGSKVPGYIAILFSTLFIIAVILFSANPASDNHYTNYYNYGSKNSVAL